VNPKGYYEGDVIARHSWCGYLGMCKTFDAVQKLIEEHKAETEAREARQQIAESRQRLTESKRRTAEIRQRLAQ
jgi:hypothetical protein